MTVDRSIPTISSDPGGVSGSDWTGLASESLAAVWEHLGGVLTSVDQADVNVVTASLKYGNGFSAYTEPLTTVLIPVAVNTGAVTLNINSVGAVAIVRPDGTGLQAGDLVVGQPVTLVYVQSLNKFVFTNFVDYSQITASLPQVKKRWLVDAELASSSSGSERTLCTFSDVQGEAGDILIFPSFRNNAINFAGDFYLYGECRDTAAIYLKSTGVTTQTNTYELRFYKDSTLVATMATFVDDSSGSDWDITWGEIEYKDNIHMYVLEDDGTYDYSIRLVRTDGSTANSAALINGAVELFTSDGTFS